MKRHLWNRTAQAHRIFIKQEGGQEVHFDNLLVEGGERGRPALVCVASVGVWRATKQAKSADQLTNHKTKKCRPVKKDIRPARVCARGFGGCMESHKTG